MNDRSDFYELIRGKSKCREDDDRDTLCIHFEMYA